MVALRAQPTRRVAAHAADMLSRLGRQIGAAVATAAQVAGTPSDHDFDADAPLRIEFIGPSGVGKSTFAKAVLAELRTHCDRRLRPYVLSSERALRRSRGLQIATAHESLYTALLTHKASRILASDQPPQVQAVRLDFMTRNLLEDIRLSCLTNGEVVVRDDGILHNFGSIVVMLAAESVPIDAFLSRRIVVACRADPDVVARRVLLRQARGGSRPQYVGLTDVQVQEIVRRSYEAMAGRIELLRARGVPVIEAETSLPLSGSPSPITEFLLTEIERCRGEDASRTAPKRWNESLDRGFLRPAQPS